MGRSSGNDMREVYKQVRKILGSVIFGKALSHFHSPSIVEIPLKNLKKNMKNLKTKYGGTPQFIL